jgi:hypothetical protein
VKRCVGEDWIDLAQDRVPSLWRCTEFLAIFEGNSETIFPKELQYVVELWSKATCCQCDEMRLSQETGWHWCAVTASLGRTAGVDVAVNRHTLFLTNWTVRQIRSGLTLLVRLCRDVCCDRTASVTGACYSYCCDGSLRNCAANGPFVQPPDDTWVNVEELWCDADSGKPVPVPLFPTQIQHGLTWGRTRATAMIYMILTNVYHQGRMWILMTSACSWEQAVSRT